MKMILKYVLLMLLVFSLPGCLMMGAMILSDKKPEHHAKMMAKKPSKQASTNSHQYYYYPDSYVYFDIQKSVYFYLNDSDWVMSPILPDDYKLNNYRVSFEMNSEIPYSMYNNHLQKYPKNHQKKQKKAHES